MVLSTNPKIWRGLAIIFIILTVVFALLFFFKLILITFAVGISLIVFTEQLRHYYKKQFDKLKLSKRKRAIYGLLIIIFWIATIIFIFSLSVSQLTLTLQEVNEQGLNEETPIAALISQQFSQFVPETFSTFIDINSVIKSAIQFTIGFITALVRELTSFLVVSIIMIPLLFFLYYRRGKILLNDISSFIPKKFSKSYEKALKEIGKQLNDFLTGKVVQSLVVGSIYCLGFYIIGVKGWLLFGAIAGLLNIIPYIGPIIGAIPPLLISLLVEPPLISILIIVVAVIAQGIDNFYLQPFMLAGRVKIGALLSIVLIIIGAQLYGILGMIFALPVFIVYKVVMKETYDALCGIYDRKSLSSEKRKMYNK